VLQTSHFGLKFFLAVTCHAYLIFAAAKACNSWLYIVAVDRYGWRKTRGMQMDFKEMVEVNLPW